MLFEKIKQDAEKTASATTDVFNKICTEVQTFIDKFYVKTHPGEINSSEDDKNRRPSASSFRNERSEIDAILCASEAISSFAEREECAPLRSASYRRLAEPSLDDMLRSLDKSFSETLLHYIDKKGITDVEAYKRSNVDKKTFSKIRCNNGYRPGKITAVSFAIGLRLSMQETEHLLSTAGMCLSRSNKFDVIIEYFILTGNYESIFDVNEVLYRFDQPLLGV